MIVSGSPLQGAHRGIAMTTTKLDLGRSHTEANSILSLMGNQDMYLGMLKMWQQYHIINTPILNMTELSNNVIYTNGFGQTLSYTMPGKVALPFAVEDINDVTIEKVGIARNEFYLVLNTNRFQPGDVLTYDYYDGKQAYVTKEVEPMGSNWMYTMKLTDENPRAYISRKKLQAGTPWMKVGNVGSSEWITKTSGISQDSDTITSFQFQTAYSEQAIEHFMTAHADMIEYNVNVQNTAGIGVDKGIINQYANPHLASVLYMLETADRSAYDPNNKDQKKVPIKGTGKWMPIIMEYILKEQARMEEMTYMFSKGGTFEDERGTIRKIGVGYYPQIKELGNYYSYSDTKQIPQLVKNMIGDLFYGRTDIPFHERKIRLRMGSGAMIEMQKYFQEQYKMQMPFPIVSPHPLPGQVLNGDNMNLRYNGFRFTSFTFAEAGTVEIEFDPSLDWEGTVAQTSYKGNRSKRNYTIMVEDISDTSVSNALQGTHNDVKEGFNNGANVVLIKPKAYANTRMVYKVGTYCPDFLRAFVGAGQNTHIASHDFDGFKVMRKWAGEVWVKDPSRVVLMEMQDEARLD